MLSFRDVFGAVPTAAAEAAGRVNLLGEHTDYTGGLVLPIGIRHSTRVRVAPSTDGRFRVYSATLNERIDFDLDAPPVPGFGRYVQGCVHVLERIGHSVPAVCIWIESDVPIGAGLSSSAALEIAVLRALRQLMHLSESDVELALLAQQAEVEYAGVNCGILDQMASSLGDREHMLYLDTRSLEHRRLPLPAHGEVIVVDTGTSRALAASAYNRRREECETAARLLGVNTLRDAESLLQIGDLPEPYNRRARHVVTENRRVLEALDADAHYFGTLMNDSHSSLKTDYDVSSRALDALVEALQRQPSVYGAKLTGAGFGGACVALVRQGEGPGAAQAALEMYRAAGYSGGRPLS